MRQFVSEVEPDKKGSILVSGKKFHYLSSVLRTCVGDMLYVSLPSGTIQQMTVSNINLKEKNILLTVAGSSSSLQKNFLTATSASSSTNSALPVTSLPECQLWLFMFVAKPPKMDLIIRQAVECGVSVIVPVEGKFCQAGSIESARKKSCAKDERWNRIITEAREQSGSPVQTKILPCTTLEKACALWQTHVANKNGLAVVLYEQTEKTVMLHEAFYKATSSSCNAIETAAVMVGSEGGIDRQEILFASECGFVPVHFATNILRCETAALYGIATLQNVIVENKIWQFKK